MTKIEAAIKEMEREIAMRKNVYKGLVSTGKMTQEQSDFRIEIMEWILEGLNEHKEQFDTHGGN